MLERDEAIEEIWQIRHQISEKYHHDTRNLVSHYRKLEKKYLNRMFADSRLAPAGKALGVGESEPPPA